MNSFSFRRKEASEEREEELNLEVHEATNSKTDHNHTNPLVNTVLSPLNDPAHDHHWNHLTRLDWFVIW